MDELRRLSISSALRRYRQTVQEHNLATLKIIADVVIAKPAPRMSRDTAAWKRLRAMERFVSIPAGAIFTEPHQVLSMDLQLDGTVHEPVEWRQAWFTMISAELDDAFPPLGFKLTFLPADLEYLCSLTNVILGAGLHRWWDFRMCNMLSSVRYESPAVTSCRIVIPARGINMDDLFTGLWNHEVAVGVRIGDGEELELAGSYVLYCCKGGDWAWRYAVHDGGWASDIYDTLEEYLEFHSHFREPTEQEARDAIIIG